MPRVSATTKSLAAALTFDDLKDIFSDLLDMGNDISRALRDGFQLTDLISIFSSAAKLRHLGPKIRPAGVALKALDPTQRGELINHLARSFRLESAAVAEARIKKFIYLVEKTYIFICIGGVRIVEDWKNALKK